MDDNTLYRRIQAAAANGNPQAMQLARLMGRSGRGAVNGYGVNGRVAGRVAGYGLGAEGTQGAGAASSMQGGFANNPGDVQVGWVEPNTAMGSVLGFDSGSTTLVAAGATFQLTSRPQEVFRGERFVIGSDIAPSLTVTDFKVANRSQLINSTAIPGMAFAHNTTGAALRFETAQPGQDVVWSGTNISGGALRVLGTLFGTSLTRK